jgi:hypothetical protein
LSNISTLQHIPSLFFLSTISKEKMKKNLLLLSIIISFASLLTAQRVEIKLNIAEIEAGLNKISFPDVFFFNSDNAPFLALSVTTGLAANIDREDFSVLFFYETPESAFNMKFLKHDHHASKEGFVSQLFLLPANASNFSFKVNKNELAAETELTLHFYNPGHTPESTETAELRSLEDCNCPQPDFQDREDWCPTGNCPEITNPVFTDVTHLIVHHSAGVNTSSDWAAVVRGIWDYHVNSNGWDDVGYNWLVDPNGVLYEGRGDDVRGAHFCGNNTNTQGVCMMGTYIDDVPTEEAMTTLKEYLAWKSAKDNIDPTAVSNHVPSAEDIPQVAGHRDGCNTSCPGDMLYASMGQLRTDIREYQATVCGHPHSVTDLDLSLQNETTVNLTWIDNSTTEDAYLVQRATGVSGNFSTIATLPTDTEVYSDTSPETGTLYRYQVLSMAGDSTSTCQLEAQITTSGTSANENVLTKEEVTILPNPAQNFVRILLNNNYTGQVAFELTDVTGKQTSIFKITEKGTQQTEVELNLQDLVTGVYLVRVTAGSHVGTFRLVKQ